MRRLHLAIILAVCIVPSTAKAWDENGTETQRRISIPLCEESGGVSFTQAIDTDGPFAALRVVCKSGARYTLGVK